METLVIGETHYWIGELTLAQLVEIIRSGHPIGCMFNFDSYHDEHPSGKILAHSLEQVLPVDEIIISADEAEPAKTDRVLLFKHDGTAPNSEAEFRKKFLEHTGTDFYEWIHKASNATKTVSPGLFRCEMDGTIAEVTNSAPHWHIYGRLIPVKE